MQVEMKKCDIFGTLRDVASYRVVIYADPPEGRPIIDVTLDMGNAALTRLKRDLQHGTTKPGTKGA